MSDVLDESLLAKEMAASYLRQFEFLVPLPGDFVKIWRNPETGDIEQKIITASEVYNSDPDRFHRVFLMGMTDRSRSASRM